MFSDDSPTCSSMAKKRRLPNGIKENLLEKVNEMLNDKKVFHSKVLDILK